MIKFVFLMTPDLQKQSATVCKSLLITIIIIISNSPDQAATDNKAMQNPWAGTRCKIIFNKN